MSRVPRGLVLVLSLFLAVAGAHEALAQWPNSPTVNVPLCVASGAQSSIQTLADGSGGMCVRSCGRHLRGKFATRCVVVE